MFTRLPWLLAAAVVIAACLVPVLGQERLKAMPGYARYQKLGPLIPGSVASGAVTPRWNEAGTAFDYALHGRHYRYDLAARRASPLAAPPARERVRVEPRESPERGRQYTIADSPDGRLRARYNEQDRNLYLLDRSGGAEVPITTDGSREKRIKNGTASWVYGEELDQTTAIWWSPDSRRVAFYRFDESQVADYYLQIDQTKLQSTVDVEAYPKAGTANPLVDLFVYDVESRKATRVDVRSGEPFRDDVVGYYAYTVRWTPDGKELLFNRTNRRQNVLEVAAADPATGEVRVVIREEWPASWVENSPAMVFLADGRRFIWQSERNGWSNFYLYDLSGRLLSPLTRHTTFEAAVLVKVVEGQNAFFYTARDGDNPLKLQLHRASLDGGGGTRLTDPQYHHTVSSCLPDAEETPAEAAAACPISPDGQFVVDVYQRHDVPPATRLLDGKSGTVLAEVAASDVTRFAALGLRKAELFTFRAADGETTLHGLIRFPSTFDPARRYPLLLQVYGGPGSASTTAAETFATPTPLSELGVLHAHVNTRAAPGRGKRTRDALYMKLGQVEVDDLAAGVRSLAARSYVDAARIGIYGTSYGGYAALLSILRHPELYAAASASSPVTAWEHYDTIYTERYMRTPKENPAGYAAGSALTHAGKLRGRLMLYYGTADNNVHPSNTLQLIAALQAAGKSFDVQVGPDLGHTGISVERMMEFFIDAFALPRPAPDATGAARPGV